MKFSITSLFTVAAVSVASAIAQKAHIALPTNGSDVQAGQDLLIKVDRPNFLSSAVEVAIVLGLTSCNPTCRPPQDGIGPGSILYKGPFDPKYKDGFPMLQPHENFTVNVPNTTPKGTAQLSLIQFDLIGASLGPNLAYDAVYVNVV
ncbi:hypothetical protein PM082_009501 [Marasmius tenuissimus]|nr:hypothetical protein PM082_009501 [Marasmius tenuissimus]